MFLFCFNLVTSISFYMTGEKDVCFHKYFSDDETMRFEYMISGEDESNTKVIILDPSGHELFSQSEKDYDSFMYQTKSSGEYQACFFPNTRAENSVTFSFYGESDAHHIKFVKNTDVSQMQQDLYNIDDIFDKIEKNAEKIIERQKTQAESKLKIN